MFLKIHFSVCFLFVKQFTMSNASCREGGFYFNGTTCLECPSGCAFCVSETNCSRCTNGFFGDQCQLPCLQDCPSSALSEGCHRQYGHCTLGCKDGFFALPGIGTCTICPKNCTLCSSMSNCISCRNGFYGLTCSDTCPSSCANQSCHQFTGKCVQCKDGFYEQGDQCLQCSDGCRSCVNATYCSECQKTHVGIFKGRCIRKCSPKLKNFVSDSSKICGISLDILKQNQSSCLNVSFERRFTCTTYKSCIDCHRFENECRNRTTNDAHMCVAYEKCNTECKPSPRDYLVQRGGTTSRNVLCDQTCFVYDTSDGKTENKCLLTTDNNRTRTEEEFIHIKCDQESERTEDVISVEEDSAMPIAVFVLLMTVVITVLMIVALAYLYRKWPYDNSLSMLIELSSEVEKRRGLTGAVHDHVTTTF